MSHIERWCRERAITEIEALMPDMSGVARGKAVPVAAYCRTLTLGLDLPEALVLQTVTGDCPEERSASAGRFFRSSAPGNASFCCATCDPR